MYVAKLTAPSGEQRELSGRRPVVPGNGYLFDRPAQAERALQVFLGEKRAESGWTGRVVPAEEQH